jgi:hypothetical protein
MRLWENFARQTRIALTNDVRHPGCFGVQNHPGLVRDQQAKLTRMATEQCRAAETLVQEAVERFLNYDEWFSREVDKSGAWRRQTGTNLSNTTIVTCWSRHRGQKMNAIHHMGIAGAKRKRCSLRFRCDSNRYCPPARRLSAPPPHNSLFATRPTPATASHRREHLDRLLRPSRDLPNIRH